MPLDTEMVVRNWVLCVSQTVAEQLVRVREQGTGAAQSAYAELREARSCGQFPEMHVILRRGSTSRPLRRDMTRASFGLWSIFPVVGHRLSSLLAASPINRTGGPLDLWNRERV